MKKRETDNWMGAIHMGFDRVLTHLSTLKDRTEATASPRDDVADWMDDIAAIEAAVATISTLQDEGINDAEALKDLIFDYNLAVKQNRENHRKFETSAKAIQKDGVWHCPECNHRVAPRHSFCHWCGKKLGWR